MYSYLIEIGQRIEIEEIESQMLSLNNIKDGKVVAVTVNGQHTLCAFIVPSTTKSVTSKDKLEFKLKRAGLRNIESSAVPLQKHIEKEKWTKRNTIRSFRAEPVTFSEFSALLHKIPTNASVNTFIYALKIDQIAPGFYQYINNSLVRKSTAELDKNIFPADNQAIFSTCAFVIFFANNVSSESSSQLEAGFIGQRLMMSSSSIDIGLCPLGGFDYYGVRRVLGVDKETCFFAHGIIGGKLGSAEIQRSEANSLPENVKSSLAKKLPKYMIPNYVFQVEKLPVSSNLKIDRKQLVEQAKTLISSTKKPEPQQQQQVTPSITYSAQGPRSDIDIVSSAIKTVLNLSNVDIKANFFDLGANSLTLIRIHRKISETYKGIELLDLFKHPSVHLLCDLIQQKGLSAPKPEPVAM